MPDADLVQPLPCRKTCSSVSCENGETSSSEVTKSTAKPVDRELLGQVGPHEVAVASRRRPRARPGGVLPSTMICSGVRTCGSEASAPGIGSCVSRLSPSGAQSAPVATTTISAPYSRTPSASSRRPVSTSTFRSLSSWIAPPVERRGAHSPRPGSCGIQRMIPPMSSPASTRWTRRKPRLPSTIAHSIPAGPAPTTSTSRSRVLRRLEALRVPAAPELLARGRVLGAADVAARVRLRDADVAADALADLVEPSLLDLAREERVGDRRPRGADHVPDAARDDLRHLVGVGEARDADDRLRGRLAHVPRPLELPALLEEARGAGVLRPLGRRADRHVPEVDEVVGEAHELEPLVEVDAVRAQRGDGDARRDGALAVHRLARQLEELESRSAPGSRASRRTRRCAGCRTARGTAWAGSCAPRRRRRCRSRPRARAAPRPPSRPARAGCRRAPSPSASRAGSRSRAATARSPAAGTRGAGSGRPSGAARRRRARRARAPRRT